MIFISYRAQLNYLENMQGNFLERNLGIQNCNDTFQSWRMIVSYGGKSGKDEGQVFPLVN
jgi:hypothetical protein